MDNDFKHLSKKLDAVITKMQKIQAKIASSQEPASMHELDGLTQLGKEYAATVEQITLLKSDSEKNLS